jgi:Lar family restriction alleviation protein
VDDIAKELRPCPFCGNKDNAVPVFANVIAVRCGNDDCEAEGPIAESDAQAITAWNTRAADALEGRAGARETIAPEMRAVLSDTLVRSFEHVESLPSEASIRADERDIPEDIVTAVTAVGEVEWGSTPAHDADGHADHVRDSVNMTAEHFGQDGPQEMHGLYLKGTDIVLCHTGTSPNSPQHARALAGAWNHLVARADAIRATPDSDEKEGGK